MQAISADLLYMYIDSWRSQRRRSRGTIPLRVFCIFQVVHLLKKEQRYKFKSKAKPGQVGRTFLGRLAELGVAASDSRRWLRRWMVFLAESMREVNRKPPSLKRAQQIKASSEWLSACLHISNLTGVPATSLPLLFKAECGVNPGVRRNWRR